MTARRPGCSRSCESSSTRPKAERAAGTRRVRDHATRLAGRETPGIEDEDAVGGLRGGSRVRDEYSGTGVCFDLIAQQGEDLAGGARIEVPGGLIGQHQARPVHQRASDRHALHFAAR